MTGPGSPFSARRRFGLESTKIVLITDAAYLAKPQVREALALLDRNNGEIWAKLDAGTQEFMDKVNCPDIPLWRVLANILALGKLRGRFDSFGSCGAGLTCAAGYAAAKTSED